MSAPKHIFVTGATGFVGSHLAARLLDAGHFVSVLARGSKTASAEIRVREVLRDVGISRFEKLKVFEGDISLPNLGLTDAAKQEIVSSAEEVWHCAASLSFQQEDRDEIFRMNVDGTRNVLDLLKQTPARRIHHVSTAYIAGNRPDRGTRNADRCWTDFQESLRGIEVSGGDADCWRADERSNRGVRLSPQHCHWGFTIGTSHPLPRCLRFHSRLVGFPGAPAAQSARERIDSFAAESAGSEAQTLNFVPIDYVVNGMLEISRRADSAGGTYHLANPVPTENRVWLPNICRVLRVEGIHLVGEKSFLKAPMTKLEALFQKQMEFYYQYLQGEPRFDCRRALDVLKNTGIECPVMTGEFIDKMAGWYVDFLNARAG